MKGKNTKHKVIGDRGAETLQIIRRDAQRHAKIVRVEGYSRKTYRLSGSEARLARWADMETALMSLMKNVETESVAGRPNFFSGSDREMAERVICLLDDTFKPRNIKVVSTTGKTRKS